MSTFQRTITNELHSLESLMHAVTNFLEDQGVSTQAVYRINLALEEMITNTIKFGYFDYDLHNIDVSAVVDDTNVTVVIEDDGREFDPLAQKEVDANAPLEQRKIGGLGIHLIRKMLDSVEYQRDGLHNRLTLRTSKNPVAE